jgi:hypothetical protein
VAARIDVMLFCDRLTDIADHRLDIEMARGTSAPLTFAAFVVFEFLVHAVFDLLHHHETLFAFDLDGKGRDATRPQDGVTLFHRGLDVLRMMGPGTDNNDVFEAARNEEFAMAEETQIASPQVRPVARGQTGPKRLLRFLRLIPIPVSHARSGNPILSDLVRHTLRQVFVIDDEDALVLKTFAAADQDLGARRTDTWDGDLVLF